MVNLLRTQNSLEYTSLESLPSPHTGLLHQIDSKADMWSLGMILHKLLFFSRARRLTRLLGELQKSKETGAAHQHLTGALGYIHDNLNGSVPQNLPGFNSTQLPPVRPPQKEPPTASLSGPPTSETPYSLLSHLQSLANSVLNSTTHAVSTCHPR